MVTREEFHAAYDAWKAANDEHKLIMEAVMEGLPLDVDKMHQRLAERSSQALARETRLVFRPAGHPATFITVRLHIKLSRDGSRVLQPPRPPQAPD